MKRLLLLAAIAAVCLQGRCQNPPFVQAATGHAQGGSVTSVSATFAANNTTNNSAIVALWMTGVPCCTVGVTMGDTPNDLFYSGRPASNCGAYDSGRMLCVFLINKLVGGSNTVTATFGASITSADLSVAEYSGTAVFALESQIIPSLLYNQASLSAAGYATTSQTTIVAIGASTHSGVTAYASSGYTPRPSAFVSESTDNTSLGMVDLAQPSPGNFSPSVSGVGANLDGVAMVVIRSTLPSPGALISWGCSTNGTAVVSLTCPLQMNLPAGYNVVLTIDAALNDDAPGSDVYNPTINDTAGETTASWNMAAIQSEGSGPGSVNTFYHTNSGGGGNFSITVGSVSGGAQNYDVIATVVNGIPYNLPLVNATQDGQSAVTNVTTGSIAFPPGTYYYYGTVGDDLSGASYTVSSGYNPQFLLYNATPNFLQAVYDQTAVVGAGSSTSLSVTSTSSSSFRSIGLLVFGTVPQYTANVTQNAAGGGAGGTAGTERQFVLPVTVGHHVSAVEASQVIGCTGGSGAGYTITDSLGNTPTLLRGGTSSDYYAVWDFPVTTGGLDKFTANCNGNVSMAIREIAVTAGVDASCATGANSTTASCSATLSQNNDYVIAYLGISNICGLTFAPVFGPSSPPWVNKPSSSGHCANTSSYDLFGASAGSLTSSWTISSAEELSAILIAYKTTVTGAVPYSNAGSLKDSGKYQDQ